MRVIITGGTGLIGRPLAALLVRHGYEVIILSRQPKRHDPPAGAKLHGWDARSGDGWHHLIHHKTAIINLAGENPAASRWTDEHKQRVLDSRLNAVQAVHDAIIHAHEQPAALLQASAVGYYGDCGAAELTEDSGAGANWRADVTAQWEASAQPIAQLGVRTVWLRIGIVLDKAGGALPAFISAAQLMGRQLGDGQQYIPWVHNADVVAMIRFLMLKERAQGIYNLVAPNPATNADLMQSMAQVMQRPALIPVPALALKLTLGEMATTVLDSQRVLPERLQESGYAFAFPTVQDALRDLLR